MSHYLIKLFQKIADGFDMQKGSIFGFGTHAEHEPESVCSRYHQLPKM